MRDHERHIGEDLVEIRTVDELAVLARRDVDVADARSVEEHGDVEDRPASAAMWRYVSAQTARLDERGAGLVGRFGAGGRGLLTDRARVLGLPPAGTISSGGACRLLRAADGWIAVSLARPDDITAVPAWLGDERVDPNDLGDDPWGVVEEHIASRSGTELVERATLLGLACAVVGEQTDQRPIVAERLGPAPARPVDGARVVNLASLWAGPLTAQLLHRLGARVTKVESVRRPDGGRQHPEFFDQLHAGADFVTLDWSTDAGRARLRDLLESADVVIEGSRPRALEQLGIDARSVVRRGPQVWVSITGHGRGAASAMRVGFGDDAAAAGGLVDWVDDTPRFVGDAVADPLTGLTAAAAVADALEAGGRSLLDVALSRVAASVAASVAESVEGPIPPA